MKVAILLYGIIRHPDAVLFWKTQLPPGDIFMFSSFTTWPGTSRSHDGHINVTAVWESMIQAYRWSIVDQETYDAEINLSKYIEGKKDPWSSKNKTSLKNAVRVTHQLNSIYSMFMTYEKSYTHVLLSRTDVLFTRPIYLQSFKNYVSIPNYAHFDGYNDRFMMGPKPLVLPLMKRFEIYKETGELAERLLKRVVKKRQTKVVLENVGFTRRVRTDGTLHKAQYSVKPDCILDTAQNIHHLWSYRETWTTKCVFASKPRGATHHYL